MRVRVNLLPESYLRVRQRYRRFKQGLVLGAALLVVEVAGGVVVHVHALRTQEILTQTEEIRTREKRLRSELNAPLAECQRLEQEIRLSEQLRSKHYWSRLLTSLSDATPQRVVLTDISTNPPSWSKSLHRIAPAAAGEQPGPKGPPASATSEALPRFMLGMTVRGFAADHEAMADFVTQVHEAKLFSSLDIKETRRDTLLGRQGVAFELICHW